MGSNKESKNIELPVTELHFSEYNRNISMDRIRKMAADYNEKLVGSLTVNLRDGKYYVIDGQNRLAMLKLLEIRKAPCLVHYGLTYEEEAALFERLGSSSKPLTFLQKFKGRIEAKEPQALKVKMLIEDSGFGLGLIGGPGFHRIVALGTIEDIFSKHGVDHSKRVLGLIRETWHGDPDSIEKHFIMGMSTIVTLNGDEFKDVDFIKKMSQVEASKILSEGHAMPLNQNTGIPVAMVIFDKYNNGRSSKRLTKRFDQL